MDDIGHHAEHHLRRRLAADAAADTTGGREEIGVLALPALGDRIAHEDDPHRFARRLERRILGGIFAEPGEILAQLLLVRVLRDNGSSRERDRQHPDGKNRTAAALGNRRITLTVEHATATMYSSGPTRQIVPWEKMLSR